MMPGRARRVCFPFVGDTVGGSHLSALLLMRGLADTPYQPLVVLHEEGPLAQLLHERGVDYRVRPLPAYLQPPLDRQSAASLERSLVLRLVPFLLRHRIGIVHTNDLRMHLSWAAACRTARARYVWHQRSASFGTNEVKVERARQADAILCISEFTRHCLPEPLAHRAHVILNPFDTDAPSPDRAETRAALLAELRAPADAAVVGFVGNLIDRKRPLDFVRAAAEIQAKSPSPVVFPMFGSARDGWDARVQACARELGIEERVHLMGFRQPPERWLATCDLLLASSVEEPFGRTLVEAALVGTPVVATDSGGHAEIVDPDETGLLVFPNDPHALAEGALRLLGDPPAAAAMAARARERALHRYSIATHRDAVAAVYDALRAGRGPAAR